MYWFAVLFAAVNIAGARGTGLFQRLLVAGVLASLVWFVLTGVPEIAVGNFAGFLDAGFASIASTSADRTRGDIPASRSLR